MEIWKDIKGYEGHYQVSNYGNVRTLKWMGRNKIRELKQHQNNNGYIMTTLIEDGIRVGKLIHRLVAEAFIPNPDHLPCINHKNEIKEDNRVENLEWCTVAYNNSYGSRMDRFSQSMKGRTLTEEHCRKISESIISKHLHHTEDWKKEHSNRMKGSSNPIFGLRRKRVYNGDGTYHYVVINN